MELNMLGQCITLCQGNKSEGITLHGLILLSKRGKQTPFGSSETISKSTGLSPVTTVRAIRRLRERGLITVQYGYKKVPSYGLPCLISTKGSDATGQNGQMPVTIVSPLSKVKEETELPTQSPAHAVQPKGGTIVMFTGGKTVKNIEDGIYGEAPVPERPIGIAKKWLKDYLVQWNRYKHKKHFVSGEMSLIEQGQAKHVYDTLIKMDLDESERVGVFCTAVENWSDFNDYVFHQTGRTKHPEIPTFLYLKQHMAQAVSFYAGTKEGGSKEAEGWDGF